MFKTVKISVFSRITGFEFSVCAVEIEGKTQGVVWKSNFINIFAQIINRDLFEISALSLCC